MTTIPTILKGDDSGQITLALPEGRDFTGATLVLAYSGVTRRFTGLSAGQTLSFGFTHEETSDFKLGCKPVLMRIIGPSGSVETVENAAMRIKVTDCLGEVNAGGSFVIRPRDITGSVPVTDLGDLSSTATVNALYAKVNEIVRVLAQRSLMVLAACACLVAGADVQTATLGDLNRDSMVVTNVTGVSSGVDEDAVKGIVESTVDKAYVEALGIATDVTETDPVYRREKADYGFTQWEVGGERFIDGTVPSFRVDHDDGDVVFNFIDADSEEILGSVILSSEEYAKRTSIDELAPSLMAWRKKIVAEGDLEPIKSDVQSANAWAQNIYRYMTASTNAWFAGTNYVTNAQQASTRQRFAFEDGMDLTTVPCSMALWEIRDGVKVCVWDQRDWISWYFAFKRQQILNEINPRIDAKADKAWVKYTATGESNPADDIVWIDTPKVVLSAGYAWQRNQTTSGSFFTLVNKGGLTSVGSNRDGSYFEIKDDEGNSIFRISKTDSYMADADPSSIHVEDIVTLTVSYPSTVQPVAYCCTDLATGDFREETDPDCPAAIVWSHSGSTYTVRATPKVTGGKLFLFAKVRVEGQTKNEFAAPIEFQKIVINNITYTVGTATINGNTVLTLTR